MSTSNSPSKRAHPRFQMDGPLELTFAGQRVPCHLNNVSISAISVTTDAQPRLGEIVKIDVPGMDTLQARVARVSGDVVAFTLVEEANIRVREVEALARALG